MDFDLPSTELPRTVSAQHPEESESIRLSQAFLEQMRRRHSVRAFSRQPVAEEIVINAVATAGSSPSGANQQPWHFCAISDPKLKSSIRSHFEHNELKLRIHANDQEWLRAVRPLGTTHQKPYLTDAPWLIAVFAKLWGEDEIGRRYKHYHVMESVSIAIGMMIAALHNAGLSSLVQTSKDMSFLRAACHRPSNERPVLVVALGHASQDALSPCPATKKKPLGEIITIHRPKSPPLRTV